MNKQLLRWSQSKLVILLAVTIVASLSAGEALFFRIAGPVPTTIAGFSADGYLTWTNVATNATFTIQSAPYLVSRSNLLVYTNWIEYLQVPVTQSVTTHRIINPNPSSGMALIPAGSFTMGDSLDGFSNATPLHTVYVSAFYMDRTEVTKGLWDEVYNWAITHGYSFDSAGLGLAPTHPLQTVNWYDCVKWCNARSEKEGRTPAYYTSGEQTTVYRSGQTYVQNDWVKWNAGYRLPTEAEWEKAARGGASGHRFPWSDADTITHSRANYYSSGSYAYDTSSTRGFHPAFTIAIYPYTSPADFFPANGYGLYDMAGNLWEWCWDWYGPYSSVSQSDSRGPASGSDRVLRGGSWFSQADHCLTAYRAHDDPALGSNGSFGFRSVLLPGR